MLPQRLRTSNEFKSSQPLELPRVFENQLQWGHTTAAVPFPLPRKISTHLLLATFAIAMTGPSISSIDYIWMLSFAEMLVASHQWLTVLCCAPSPPKSATPSIGRPGPCHVRLVTHGSLYITDRYWQYVNFTWISTSHLGDVANPHLPVGILSSTPAQHSRRTRTCYRLAWCSFCTRAEGRTVPFYVSWVMCFNSISTGFQVYFQVICLNWNSVPLSCRRPSGDSCLCPFPCLWNQTSANASKATFCKAPTKKSHKHGDILKKKLQKSEAKASMSSDDDTRFQESALKTTGWLAPCFRIATFAYTKARAMQHGWHHHSAIGPHHHALARKVAIRQYASLQNLQT